jgi:hypothetical protein
MRSFKFEAHQPSLVQTKYMSFFSSCYTRLLSLIKTTPPQEGDEDLDTEASEGGGSSIARFDDLGGDECDELHDGGDFGPEDGAPISNIDPEREGGG